MNQYPVALRQPSLPVIGLINKKAIHEKVAAGLIQMNENPFRVVSFESEAQIPRRKPARVSYTGYKPEGIFPRGWMRKHQDVIPSVVLVLLDWNVSLDWRSQDTQFISAVEKVRVALTGRFTRIVLLLLMDRVPPEQTPEQLQNMESFVANIRKAVDLDRSSCQYLPESDLLNPQLFSTRFAKILPELSAQYYKETLNRFRQISKKEYKKDQQPYLFVRHRLKCAFLCEVLHLSKAFKYYSDCYRQIQNVSTKDFKEHEIRTVGDYLNFKKCQLLMDKTDDAVKQFMSHISWYRTLPGDPKLLFQHHALISRQYRAFGELLEAKQIVSSKRYLNPAFYYQAAAAFAKHRKLYMKQLCEPKRELIEPLFPKSDYPVLARDLDLTLQIGYIGQLETRDPEWPVDPKADELRPYAKEMLTVNHSEEIIQLLSMASTQYKKNQTLNRMTYLIGNSIAEEYFQCEQYDRAKKYFDHIGKHYRKEKWFDLLAAVIRHSLTCSVKRNIPRAFVEHSLELISNLLPMNEADKQQIFRNLFDFFASPSSQNMSPLDSPVTIDLNISNVLLSLQVQFDCQQTVVYSPIQFIVNVTSRAISPIRVNRMHVFFSDPNYSFVVDDSNTPYNETISATIDPERRPTSNLQLNTNGEATLFKFPITIKSKQELRVTGIDLYIGQSPNSVIFKWKMLDEKYYSALLKNYNYRGEVGNFNFVERPIVSVIEPTPNMTITFAHIIPALVNEYYCVTINIQSNADHVKSGTLIIPKLENVYMYNSCLEPLTGNISFGEIPPNTVRTELLILQITKKLGMQPLKLSARYSTTIYPELVRDASFDLRVQYPFDALYTFTSTRSSSDLARFSINPSKNITHLQYVDPFTGEFKHDRKSKYYAADDTDAQPAQTSSSYKNLEGFPVGEPFLVQTNMTCTTPYPMILHNVELDILQERNFECLSHNGLIPSDDANIMISKDTYSMCHVLRGLDNGKGLKSGKLRISCSRANPHDVADILERDMRNNETRLNEAKQLLKDIVFEYPLPGITIGAAPISVMIDTPSVAELGNPQPLDCVVQNNSRMLQEVRLQVIDSDAFFLAGTVEVTMTILPFESRVFKYTLIPVLTGYVYAPRFSIRGERDRMVICDESEALTIFVSPKTKIANLRKKSAVIRKPSVSQLLDNK